MNHAPLLNVMFKALLTGLLSLNLAHAESLTSTEERLVHDGDTLRAVIALGQINRIVLPYEEPEVRTLHSATTEIKGRVLYIAPETEGEIHLLIADARTETRGLTLSLIPQSVSPRTLTLRLEEAPPDHAVIPSPRMEASPRMMPSSLEGSPKGLLKNLALGSRPEGYRFRPPGRSDRIQCKNLPLEIRTKKVLEGPHRRILIGQVHNRGKRPVLLDEALCGDQPKVSAVASYPAGPLAPGGQLELYVVQELDSDRTAPGDRRGEKGSSP